jgi:hypothetical protein
MHNSRMSLSENRPPLFRNMHNSRMSLSENRHPLFRNMHQTGAPLCDKIALQVL